MKTSLFTATLLLALPLIAQAAPTQALMTNHPVTVVTDTTKDTPAVCEAKLQQSLDLQGWHDQIYRTVATDRAVVIYTQRNADLYHVTEVKVTFWKAVRRGGKTVTVARVYNLTPRDVNAFLDNELKPIANAFEDASRNAS